MKKIFIKLFFLMLICGGMGYSGFWLYEHRYDYFFQGRDLTDDSKQDRRQVFQENVNSKNEEDDSDYEGEPGGDDREEEGYFAPSITQIDCSNECRQRKQVPEEYRYCMEVCGLNEIKDYKKFEIQNNKVDKDDIVGNTERVGDGNDEEHGECEDIKDAFQRDVCWKELAVQAKQEKYCDEISDDKMSEVCHNRVLEEIIN